MFHTGNKKRNKSKSEYRPHVTSILLWVSKHDGSPSCLVTRILGCRGRKTMVHRSDGALLRSTSLQTSQIRCQQIHKVSARRRPIRKTERLSSQASELCAVPGRKESLFDDHRNTFSWCESDTHGATWIREDTRSRIKTLWTLNLFTVKQACPQSVLCAPSSTIHTPAIPYFLVDVRLLRVFSRTCNVSLPRCLRLLVRLLLSGDVACGSA